jgi:raffinose/stachyose/melibiose transport system permease protein
MSGMRYTWRTFARELSMLALAAIWLIPFYFLVVMAVKPSPEIFDPPTALPSHVALSNFSKAWAGSGAVTLGQGLKSSAIITVFSVLLLILVGSIAAYALARRVGHLSTILYFLFVLGIILPFQLGIVPAYVALRKVGLVGSYVGLIVLYTGLLMPLTVFLYTGFVRTLPRDYEEAAQIDGATRFTAFWRITLPLAAPALLSVTLFAFTNAWNEFLFAVVLSGNTVRPVTVAMFNFVSVEQTLWAKLAAVSVLAMLPVVILGIVAQKNIVKGLTVGAVKGGGRR